MEIKKVWDRMFRSLLWLTIGLLIVMVGVGFFWSKSTEYFKQIWPSFIGTCFGVVFSAGFAGAFLVWQLTREEQVKIENQKTEALVDLGKWEAVVSGFLSRYALKAPTTDFRLFLVNLNKVRDELTEIRVQAGGIKVRIRDIKRKELTLAFDELAANIDELNVFLNSNKYGNIEELSKLVDGVRLNFTKVQSVSSGLEKLTST